MWLEQGMRYKILRIETLTTTREKEMRILERDFQINESVYTFLAQKKLEAQIATSALMSFHRIIQPAIPAKKPISPNKVLITFVCGFLGILIGILIVFGRKVVSGKIFNKSDIEKLTSTQVIGVLTNTKDQEIRDHEFVTLAKSIEIQLKRIENQTILVTSGTKLEGKSFISQNLATVYSKMGYSVALIDINFGNPSFNSKYDVCLNALNNETNKTNNKLPQSGTITTIGLSDLKENGTLILSHKNMPNTIKKIKTDFDIVIIDTPGSVISIDGLTMLKYSDICLYSVRANVSKSEYIENIDVIQNDFETNQMKIVLNGAHKSTNYSGNFNGSQLSYNNSPKGLLKKINHYLSTYAR